MSLKPYITLRIQLTSIWIFFFLLMQDKLLCFSCTFIFSSKLFTYVFSRQWTTDWEAGGEIEHTESGKERHGAAAARFPAGSLQLDSISAGSQQSLSFQQHSCRSSTSTHWYIIFCGRVYGHVCVCMCSHVETLGEMWVPWMCFARQLLCSKLRIDAICFFLLYLICWKYSSDLWWSMGGTPPTLSVCSVLWA